MADDKPAPKPFKVGEEPRPEMSGRGSQFLPRPPEAKHEDARSPMWRRAMPRLKMVRNFVMFSLRHLRPAEVNVWLAIFNCEYDGEAQIGYERLAELTGRSTKHVGKAVRDLMAKGLLVRKVKGKFRAGNDKRLSSIYRLRAQMKPEDDGLPKKPR